MLSHYFQKVHHDLSWVANLVGREQFFKQNKWKQEKKERRVL